MIDWKLEINEWGKLVMVEASGESHVGVTPVRAFPISAPSQGISILHPDGRELCWIDSLEELPLEMRTFLEAELLKKHFLPEIRKILAIDGMTEPTIWRVITDRGESTFKLKSEENVRRFGGFRAMISDANEVRYLIPDLRQLDSSSRKILGRYL
jgi:hypothetical protein